MQAAARAQILSSPSLMKDADDPITGFGWFTYINSEVARSTRWAAQGRESAADKVA